MMMENSLNVEIRETIKKLKEQFKVAITFSEHSEVSNCVVETSDEIELLEMKFKRLSDEVRELNEGYYKTDFQLSIGEEVFYKGRLDIGDYNYENSGIAKHIFKWLTYLHEEECEDTVFFNNCIQYFFSEVELEELDDEDITRFIEEGKADGYVL